MSAFQHWAVVTAANAGQSTSMVRFFARQCDAENFAAEATASSHNSIYVVFKAYCVFEAQPAPPIRSQL